MSPHLPRTIAGLLCLLAAVVLATWEKWPLLLHIQTKDLEQIAMEDAPMESLPAAISEEEKGPTEFVLDLQSGESLYAVLRRQNIAAQKIHQVVQALKPHFNPRNIRPDHDLHITTKPGEDNIQNLLSLTLRPNITTEIHIKAKGDQFIAAKKVLKLVEKKNVITGKVDMSLYADARAKQMPDAIVGQMIRGFSYDIDFQRSITPGTAFGAYYTTFINENTKQKEPGDLLYAFITVGGKTYRIYRFAHKDGSIGFYNAKAESIRKSLLKTPVDGARLSSRFGMRHHPVLGYTKMHKGIDFAAPVGTPIMAAGDGKILRAGRFNSYGHYVRIQHNSTYDTAYAHLCRYGPGIKSGKWVRQGQVIGYVGATGRCSGPHLHYEVLKNGTQINPAKITQLAGNQLKGNDYANFMAMKKAIDQLFDSL
ncbi:M23 family metallopeptidase [Alphaproteobacteria bacterium]|nr:M23 family metallopeptidase [Alphaproteobacteria bacterium]MDC0344799.1 M23 family metallopeptidase [Alphaproteobacteria bacterium]